MTIEKIALVCDAWVNVHGGAGALEHPTGSSAVRSLTNLIYELQIRDGDAVSPVCMSMPDKG